MEVKRICIYPKDVERITGLSSRSGRRLLSHIRQHLRKNSNQFVSVEEFCQYTGLDIERVKTFISG